MSKRNPQKRELKKIRRRKERLEKKREQIENPPALGINVKETVKAADTVR